MNIVALSQTILREQGRRVLHMVASAVFEGSRKSSIVRIPVRAVLDRQRSTASDDPVPVGPIRNVVYDLCVCRIGEIASNGAVACSEDVGTIPRVNIPLYHGVVASRVIVAAYAGIEFDQDLGPLCSGSARSSRNRRTRVRLTGCAPLQAVGGFDIDLPGRSSERQR